MVRGPRAVAVVLVAAVLALVGAPAASADFASQCATPDRTVAPTDPSINVATGETVLVAAGFSGGIDGLPAGGTLCVGPGATLTASYMNNAAGALVVASGGALQMPSIVVAAGFSLELEGAATFAGLGVNGSAQIHVAPGAELTISSDFSPAAGSYVNEGTITVQGSMNLNTAVSFDNTGSLAVQGGGTVNGPLTNAGLVTFGGGLTVNSSGTLQNSCVLSTAGDLANNGTGSGNAGLVLVSGNFSNNGAWQQTQDGVTSAVGLTDDGAVTGFGGYLFTGFTSVQGSWVGDSASDPIRVQSTAPAGQIFDVATGTIANVVRAPVDALDQLPACAAQPAPTSADVEVAKSGPATVLEGDVLTYTVLVRNNGEDPAADVVVIDPLPAGFTLDPTSTTGTLDAGVLTWQVGTLAVGQVIALPFSGTVTAPAGSTLLNVARSTSSTLDPVPSNNDGTGESSQASTEVLAVPPPSNQAPVAIDLVRDTITRLLVVGTVTATDPDADQELTFTLTTPPGHGRVYLSAGGGFVYVSDPAFAGIDTFGFEVCDNASPTPACDTGTVRINVRPFAVDDAAVTFQDTAVTIPVVSNDTLGAPLQPTLVASPAHGSVTLDPATGQATYTPDAGYTGTDSFQYQICSPTEPTFCDTATVRILVVPLNLPPTVDPLTLTTTTGTPVTGALVIADPNPGDTVTADVGIPPRSGTSTVEPGGSTTYSPLRFFAGRDYYGVVVCDDGVPVLCATGRVTVEVVPVAAPDTATTPEGTAVDIDIAGNDRGAVGPATVTGGPSHGSVTITGGTARYTPEPGFTGTDTFEYRICAAIAPDLCATTTVTITVTAVPPVPVPEPEPDEGVLAVTGAETAPVLGLGLGLLLAGGALVLVGRRRT